MYQNKIKEVWLLVMVITVSRLPFVFNSIGCDFDIWREAFSGKMIREQHIYNVSRFPGYPFSEFLFSLIYKFPYWFINSFSVLFTIGSAIFLYEILLLKNIKKAFLISLAFSFVPIIFINSTIAIDYNWSLFFILGCTYFLMKEKITLATIFFGLIVSSRFNNFIFILPFLYFIYTEFKEKRREYFIRFFFGAVFFSLLFFSPVIIRYNGKFLYHYGADNISLKQVISFSTLYIFGLIGCISLLFFSVKQFWTDRKTLFINLSKTYQDNFLIFSAIMVLLNFLFFIKFPLEAGYLTPSIPFFLILISNFFSKRPLKLFLISLFFSPFLFFLSAQKFEVLGMVFSNEKMENQQLENSKNLINKIDRLPKNSVVFVSDSYEHLAFIKGGKGFTDKKILKKITLVELKTLKEKSIQIFYTEEAKTLSNQSTSAYLEKYGKCIHPIFINER